VYIRIVFSSIKRLSQSVPVSISSAQAQRSRTRSGRVTERGRWGRAVVNLGSCVAIPTGAGVDSID
jgi:hypothetical protein